MDLLTNCSECYLTMHPAINLALFLKKIVTSRVIIYGTERREFRHSVEREEIRVVFYILGIMDMLKLKGHSHSQCY